MQLATQSLSSPLRLFACVGFLGIVGMVATIAAEASEDRRVVVQYGDLDLSRPEGVHVLYHRIQHAALQVCVTFDSKSLELHTLFDSCRRGAVENAVALVASPELTAYHIAQTGVARKPERFIARAL